MGCKLNATSPTCGKINSVDKKVAVLSKEAYDSLTNVPDWIQGPPGANGKSGLVELTRAEYEALSEEQKMADIVYMITDEDGQGEDVSPYITNEWLITDTPYKVGDFNSEPLMRQYKSITLPSNFTSTNIAMNTGITDCKEFVNVLARFYDENKNFVVITQGRFQNGILRLVSPVQLGSFVGNIWIDYVKDENSETNNINSYNLEEEEGLIHATNI